MTTFLVTFAAMTRLIAALIALLKKPEARALLLWMVVLFVIGTVFYHLVEGWSWLDSLYYCVITLSTVGYGDFSPTTPESKIFTMIYVFAGISIFVSFVNMLVQVRQERHEEKKAQRQGGSPDNGAEQATN